MLQGRNLEKKLEKQRKRAKAKEGDRKRYRKGGR